MSLCLFRLIQSIFRSIEIALKFYVSVCLFRLIETRESIFKKSYLTCSNKLFQNFFLSLWLDKAPQRFFIIFLQISCKVSLSLSRYIYTLPFALIFTFSCIISWFLGNFWTMHNLGFLINQALFYEFDQWILLLQCCIHDLCWLI